MGSLSSESLVTGTSVSRSARVHRATGEPESMRVVILGAGGMLGHKCCQALAGHTVYGTFRGPASAYHGIPEVFANVELIGGVDVLEEAALRDVLERVEPHCVVNCVGIVKQHTDIADPCQAIALNALFPHRLARLCAKLNSRLIHISTDCVFSGDRGRYAQSDPPDAQDTYGRTKALGETLPNEAAAVTLRTSFIGRELRRPGRGLMEWFLAQEGGHVKGYARSVFSGVTTMEMARVVGRVMEEHAELRGIHQVASTPISKYDLLRLIREQFDLDVAIERAEEPVCDRSLVPSPELQRSGCTPPTWAQMIEEMSRDQTPYSAVDLT